MKASSQQKEIIKKIFLLRHGQAQHNPRAEAARAKGCSHETFLQLMHEDDVLDSELTELGREQAKLLSITQKEKLKHVELIISSPLSRAIQTAEFAVPVDLNANATRIAVETFREINGWLLNAKRRCVSELRNFYPHWIFENLSNEDKLWTPNLESESSCGERGYQGLIYTYRSRKENNILIVSHGGLLRFALVNHPRIKLECGRGIDQTRSVSARFNNCEIREYEMKCEAGEDPIITLREITES